MKSTSDQWKLVEVLQSNDGGPEVEIPMRAGLQNRPRLAIASLSLLALLFVHTVAAEERPRQALEVAAGALLFADDGVVKEGPAPSSCDAHRQRDV